MDIYKENKKHVNSSTMSTGLITYHSLTFIKKTPRYITLIYEGYSESNLRWTVNKTNNEKKNVTTYKKFVHT
jgi:hypothetical protein